jgi:hypothetical protein
MNYRENYAGLSDDQLLMIAASRADLVQEAALALDFEMARRGLSYQEARAKKRDVARREIREVRRHRPSKTASKYFVSKMNGWMVLLLALGVPLLVIALMFFQLVPGEWDFPILTVCMGAVIAVSAVQPWLRQTASFWISLVVSSTVQLCVGYWISVHLAPQTRGELKGAAVLAIVPGYAVGTVLFLLLQKLGSREGPRLESP